MGKNILIGHSQPPFKLRLLDIASSIWYISGCVSCPRKRCTRLLSIVNNLFQLNHRGLLKGCIVVYQDVRRLMFLFLRAGSHRCHDKRWCIPIPHVVLQNNHRAGTALFRANMRLHVGKVNVTSKVLPVFWYYAIRPPILNM